MHKPRTRKEIAFFIIFIIESFAVVLIHEIIIHLMITGSLFALDTVLNFIEEEL